MIIYLIPVLFLISFGVALSILVLPNDEVLALMYMKDKEFDTAKAYFLSYMDKIDEMPDSAVLPLAKLHLQNGEVNKAVGLLEAFLKRKPDNMEARRLLSTYYQYDQRPTEYLQNLESIIAKSPDKDAYIKLSHLYNQHGQYEDQIRILYELIQYYPEDTAHYMDLIRILAAHKRHDESVEVMRKLSKEKKGFLKQPEREMMLDLLMLADQPREAVRTARSWLKENYLPEWALRYTDQLHYGVGYRTAWELIGPYGDKVVASPPLFAKWTELAVAMGEVQLAYPLLYAQHESGHLPTELTPQLAELALLQNLVDEAFKVSLQLEPGEIPDWLAINLVTAAMENKRQDLAHKLNNHLSEAFFQQHPVLAAELSLALNSRRKAEVWADKALPRRDLSVDKQLRLASLLMRLERTEEAISRIRKLAPDPSVPPWLLYDLAGFMLRTASTEEGLKVFNEIKQKRKENEVMTAWALMAAHTGKQMDELHAWFKRKRNHLTINMITDLTNVAIDRKRPKLAINGAARMVAMNPIRQNRLTLARAFLSAEQPQKANITMRRLLPVQDKQEHQLYGDILMGLWATGDRSVRKELQAYLKQRMDSPDADEASKLSLSYMAMEVGNRKQALEVFTRAAESEGPASNAMQTLRYLWGPRPELESIEWMVAQAEKADKKQLPGWLLHLVESGAPRRALAIAKARKPAPGTDPKLIDAYLRILAALNKKQRMGEIIRGEANVTKTASALHDLAKRAEEEGLPQDAGYCYRLVLDINADDHRALERLGYMAFFAGEWEYVEEYLGRFLAKYDGSYETNFYLAEVFRSTDRLEEAKPYYQVALDKIDQLKKKPFPIRLTRTRIMERLGHRRLARKQYEVLIAEQPDNQFLRADYVELLLAMNKNKEAQNVMREMGIR
uniref:Tetratricopeptide repeat protein n=1 Tax=Magnetococcus massalia (strain MO-1) TaxID=451514 RepID=A0A1S7LK23_MAGMO|nr:conserved protein of unknown function [Candidatus Magnetococcus massalia]